MVVTSAEALWELFDETARSVADVSDGRVAMNALQRRRMRSALIRLGLAAAKAANYVDYSSDACGRCFHTFEQHLAPGSECIVGVCQCAAFVEAKT